MALQPGFTISPPPQSVQVTYENGQYVSKPNPMFYVWTQRLWEWTKTLGNNIDGAASFSGSIAIGATPNWFVADASGIWLGGATFAASPFSVSMAGALKSTSGSIGGFDIGADYIRDAANSFGMASDITGGDDVRFWAGATFANRATAPFKITETGVLTATTGLFNGNIDTTGYILATGAGSGGFVIAGNATSGVTPGVYGQSTAGEGVWGTAAASSRSGVLGSSSDAGGYGVRGGNSASGYAMFSDGKFLCNNRIYSNVATGTAPFQCDSTTRVPNLNVATCGVADSAITAGTVTTAAQTAITSVGTLTSLASSGAITSSLVGVAFNASGGGEIRSTDSTVQTFLQSSSAGGGGFIGMRSNHPLLLRTNDTDRITIAAAGAVTIHNLAGTGTRTVVVNDAGLLSAP